MAIERFWPFGRASIERMGNPPNAVDRLIVIDTPDGWSAGAFKATQYVSGPTCGVKLKSVEGDTYPRRGEWTSPVLQADFPFLEIVPSWNVQTPSETGARLELRVRLVGAKDWSPWLFLGSWGKTLSKDARVTRFADGRVIIDFLTLRKPADAFQLKVEFQSFTTDVKQTPSIRRLAAVYSGVVNDSALRSRVAPVPQLTGAWARDLPVPFRTQKDAAKALRGEICSPTSTSMVCAYWGADRPTEENALAIFDADYDMFGNWGRAVQRAADLGLDAWITRFRNWDQVKAQIEQGQPIIASIQFEKGTFPSNVLDSTDGHLIVIRGFTPGGDVIVNDPASRDRGEMAVYRADELGQAWFSHGGTAYILRAPVHAEIRGAPSTLPSSGRAP